MNLARLNGVITERSKEKNYNMKKVLAGDMWISMQALGKKLCGKTKITTDDAEQMSESLELGFRERVEIFLPIASQ